MDTINVAALITYYSDDLLAKRKVQKSTYGRRHMSGQIERIKTIRYEHRAIVHVSSSIYPVFLFIADILTLSTLYNIHSQKHLHSITMHLSGYMLFSYIASYVTIYVMCAISSK